MSASSFVAGSAVASPSRPLSDGIVYKPGVRDQRLSFFQFSLPVLPVRHAATEISCPSQRKGAENTSHVALGGKDLITSMATLADSFSRISMTLAMRTISWMSP